ncbi:phosphodiester glycosidase family protein [Clostridium intestinale]|uniref:Exopolysaccharide biosynthesis protein n=1 Tax=Clostridium intestinale DSM 6191 TaxID=1121320 RepID=A0A1M5VQ13_9CLOT|nr:phosphodiester glycosidase family protein [Clostridium intestinale]WRY52395.1 phosphodiester glycosidase family protein [Clostridium intestinale]SHH77332.1 Exopolysaccharide biosynthesis protein [Clostridium intestinale DSM 6191]
MNKNKSKAKARKKKRRKKISLKRVFAFILFEIVFTAIVGPFYLYYGPFENVRKGFVGAAMTSYKSQFLATWFLSEEKINKILAENNNYEEISQDVESKEVKIPKTHDETIERYNIDGGDKFKGYLLIVKDPTRVKVGYSSKLGREGQTLSQIIENNDAIAGINAGGFTDGNSTAKWTGTGGQPEGVILNEGNIVFKGADENQKIDMIAINKDGRLIIGKYSINELNELGAKEAVTFGPTLVVNGKPTIRSGDGGWGIAPRTVIGQRSDGSIMLLVIDGRQLFGSVGATLREAQDLMIEYGAINAANLDGGKSTTMYYEGEVINTPSDSLGERSIPTAFIVK